MPASGVRRLLHVSAAARADARRPGNSTRSLVGPNARQSVTSGVVRSTGSTGTVTEVPVQVGPCLPSVSTREPVYAITHTLEPMNAIIARRIADTPPGSVSFPWQMEASPMV